MKVIDWTDRRLAELKRRHEAGEIWQVIADAIGVYERTARRKGRELGLFRRRRVDDSRGWVGLRWTPELDAIVTAGYATGKSVATIMAEIGPDCTRNMVIGRARRLGTLPHLHAKGGPGKHKPRKPESERHPRMVAAPVPPPVIGAVGNVAAAVMARRRDQCRWIDGDVMDGGGIAFCQNAAHRGSWCRAHRAVVFRPVDAVAEKYRRGPGGQRGTTP